MMLFLYSLMNFPWTGNKSDAGILKALITEPTRFMEKKFADAIQVKNCTHLIFASNEIWAIPAESTDRRYCRLGRIRL